jgi:hypothetical protein
MPKLSPAARSARRRRLAGLRRFTVRLRGIPSGPVSIAATDVHAVNAAEARSLALTKMAVLAPTHAWEVLA